MLIKKLLNKTKPLLPEVCALTVFFIISCLWLKFHETWFDEAQAWLIARDAGSYWKMIKAMSYEGHPALWHSLLFVLIKLKLPFFSLHILHLIIANLTTYLILFKSPFKRSFKIPLIFGYFFIYEYNAIGRSYALAVLLMFLIATFYQKRFEKPITYSLFIALLANTVIHGTIIAFAIFLLFTYEIITNNIKKLRATPKKYFIAIAIVLISFFLVYYQVKPSADAGLGLPWLEVRTTERPLVSIVSAFYPIPKNEINFWNSLIILDPVNGSINHTHSWYWYAAVLSFVSITTLILTLLFFAGKTKIFILYTSIIFLLSLIFLILPSRFIRHYGLEFISFIFCLWLAEYYEKKPGLRQLNFNKKTLKLILFFFLAIQITAGAIAGYYEIIYDFSAIEKTATYLKKNALVNKDNLLIGYHNSPVAGIAAYLPESKLYYFENGSFGTYVIWNKKFANYLKLTNDQKNKIFTSTINGTKYKRYILVTSFPLTSYSFALRFNLLNYFSSTIVEEESFYIYEIYPTDNPAYRPDNNQ